MSTTYVISIIANRIQSFMRYIHFSNPGSSVTIRVRCFSQRNGRYLQDELSIVVSLFRKWMNMGNTARNYKVHSFSEQNKNNTSWGQHYSKTLFLKSMSICTNKHIVTVFHKKNCRFDMRTIYRKCWLVQVGIYSYSHQPIMLRHRNVDTLHM